MVLIDLKVDNSMIDVQFEGYKVSLDPIPVLMQPVVDGIKCNTLGKDDYSYLSTRMALLQNYLFQDPFFQNCVFYCNKKQNIIWASLGQDGRLTTPKCVWSIPEAVDQSKAITSSFPNADWALLNSGSHLYVLYTPSRAAGEPWLCCHELELSTESPSYLLHATHHSTLVGQQIDCVVASVEEKSNFSSEITFPDSCSFVSILEWISLCCGQNNQEWLKKRTRKLVGPSSPEYAAIDSIGDSICVVSNEEYKFYFDSEGLSKFTPILDEKNSGFHKYLYMQNAESITVHLKLLDSYQKSDLQLNFTSSPPAMEVLIKGKCALKGQLENNIDAESSTWTVDKDRLEIVLFKTEVGVVWKELIRGDKSGEEVLDSALVDEIHSRLSYLTSDTEVADCINKMPSLLEELDECDTSLETFTFQRFDGNEHIETHRVNMSGHQWLFSDQIHPESLPALCLRHNVDGILWQPKNVSSEGEMEQFKMEHLATFSAFGYILASHQSKQFISCTPNFQYSIVSDCSRHLHLYRQPENLHSSLELRNRKTGKSVARISKHFVVSLEQCGKILGLRTSLDCIFVLSNETLYAVKILSK